VHLIWHSSTFGRNKQKYISKANIASFGADFMSCDLSLITNEWTTAHFRPADHPRMHNLEISCWRHNTLCSSTEYAKITSTRFLPGLRWLVVAVCYSERLSSFYPGVPVTQSWYITVTYITFSQLKQWKRKKWNKIL